MGTDLQNANLGIIGAVTAAVTASMAGAQDVANSLFETEVYWNRTADDANAAATQAEFILQRCPRRAMLVDAYYTPATATGVTAVAANYAQIIFQSRDGLGGSALSLGTTNTTPTANGGTGNWAGQWKNQALTVTAFDATNAVIPAGGVLTVSIAKQGAGVTLPGGTITARLRYV